MQRMAGRNRLRGSRPIGGWGSGGGNVWIWVVAIVFLLAKCSG